MVGCGDMKIKGRKAQVQITLPPELVKKAREYGLNISKIAENSLKSYIERLEGLKTETNGGSSFLGKASFSKEGFVDGAGFEPATSTMPTWRSFQADLPAQTRSN